MRSFGMVCVLTWSIAIAVVLNCLFTPAREDRLEDFSFYSAISTARRDADETHHDVEETTATLSFHGEMAKRYSYTALHQAEHEGEQYNCNNTSSVGGLQLGALVGNGSSRGAPPLVTLEERCGRPNVAEFLQVFDSSSSRRANYPAVYTCGPNELTLSVRLAIKERHYSVGYACNVALYQERFEM
jgi:hypothetical protein